ncbi:NADH-quinone oxidoreductase subunit I [Dysgonomonas sp. 25]|uniref:NuoI/complex I 23 kDa subunit family protein n=1 Tax=Dysgonomonas sp. 25 TaxID=2302933 RepID=UPI002102DDF0|nr:NADH-quinone oxidoreductase subunit I [Dysgonomonas sp. 25]
MNNISLSGRKVVANNKDMSPIERIYLVAIMKGMWITLKHFFKRKVTVQYPEQQREFSPVYRGRHVLMRDEEGREHCTACGMCALACPAEAITMTAAERQEGEENLYREEKYAKIYEINMLRCIFCGLCEEACPKEAIFLTKSKQLVKPKLDRESMIYGKDKLVISVEDGKSGKYN